MNTCPALFISHGAPDIVLRQTPCAVFLQGLAAALPKPRGIVVVSAHWETPAPAITAHPSPATLHDFGGFADELYTMRYEVPGDPDLAVHIASLLAPEFPGVALDSRRGLDHGTWMPLMLMYPDAHIPVVQLSLQSQRDAGYHFRIGECLRSLLDRGIMVIGSGNLTHNLVAALRGRFATTPPEVIEFSDWAASALINRKDTELLDWSMTAPHAQWNHPTPEHWLPLYVALGASNRPGERLHHSVDYQVLAMDAYRF